ncbi:hypothetical protein LUZ60_001691 [Juncus effusus]|nr:hypothetical protein LUZ60_001691 [Juncus effusus]
MARREGGDLAAPFFLTTLMLWAVAVSGEVWFSGRTELTAVVSGFVFFQIANCVIRKFVSQNAVLVNTAVSLLHSTFTSASVVFILMNQWRIKGARKMFEHEELVNETWYGSYFTLCFSCGYFAYDQLDMIRYRLYTGFIPAILVHHLILLVCFTLALFRNITINYLILSLFCEIHSVFLHTRKIRRMVGTREIKSLLVRIEWVFNWFAFFTTRLICHILITYKLVLDANKFEKGIELPLALLGMAGMNILNLFLGLDLFKAYKREKIQQRRQD